MNRQLRNIFSVLCATIAVLVSAGVSAEKVWNETLGEYVDRGAFPEPVPSPAQPPASADQLEWNETYGEYMPAGQKKQVIKTNPRQPMTGEKVWSETYGEYIYKTPESAPDDEVPANREK